jgi:hypothetical protein
MALARLSITSEEGGRVDAMFNPASYTIDKKVVWNTANDARANAPTVSFGGGGARELSLELFFDVTESKAEEPDVRDHTDPLMRMARIMRNKEKPRPPICTVEWGEAKRPGLPSAFPFKGLISQLSQNFTLFHRNGRPLRATVKVSFVEFLSRSDDLRETDPELTTRTVRRGERLCDIAAEVYLDPGAWREIALKNLDRIKNPALLVAGTILTCPKR